jgi:hypothetical protein
LPAFVRDVHDFQRETGHAAPKQRSMMISKALMAGRIARRAWAGERGVGRGAWVGKGSRARMLRAPRRVPGGLPANPCPVG